MTEKDLHLLLPFFLSHRVKGQSEVRLDALSRIYLVLNDLACVTSLRDYAGRAKIIRKIDMLYRAADRTSVGGLCRMYRLCKEAALAPYGEKDRECSELHDGLIGRYMERPDAAQEDDALRCIAYELGNIVDDDTESDYHPFYRMRATQWAAGLDADGCWKGLAPEKAVRRIGLLQEYGYAFRDSRFNGAVLRAYNYYKGLLSLSGNPASGSLPLLGAWYDLLRVPGILPYEPGLLGRIAGRMEKFAATAEPRSDAWYFAVSYAVVQCCTDIMDKVQREAMQNIA